MAETTSDILVPHERMKRRHCIAASTLWLLSTPTGFTVLCICLAVAFCLSNLRLSPTIGAPSAQELQFGPLVPGTEADMRIPLCNHGLLPLKILDVKAGCACLQHSLEKNVLFWREKTEIVLHYNLKGKMPGVSRERVFLQTNDWDHPYTEIRLAVQIEGGWRMLPNELLVLVPSAQKVTKTAQVLYDGQGLERIVSVRSENPHLVPTLGKEKIFALTGRRLFEILVECDSLFDGYETKGIVIVETNAPHNAVLSLPVLIRKDDYALPPQPGA